MIGQAITKNCDQFERVMRRAQAQTAMPRKPKAKTRKRGPQRSFYAKVRRALFLSIFGTVGLFAALVLLFSTINPPTTPYILHESLRLGRIDRVWAPLESVPAVLRRAVVAAEDANFCNHWGLDVSAIRAAIAQGGTRGASTISQQTVKNVFLWHGRSWVRKALEAVMTPAVEAVWSKRRTLEVYLNVAEFGNGVFGARAAARHHFGVALGQITPRQAAALAAVLPNPKSVAPAEVPRARVNAILDGAATIDRDGRARCFQS